MKNLGAYISGGNAFVRALLGRIDPVERTEAHGLTQLRDWPALPEQPVLDALAAPESTVQPEAILYCFEGSHAGETFPLAGHTLLIGTGAHCDLVLTPTYEKSDVRFQLDLSEGVQLTAPAPHAFELNGKMEYRATLVDYDEITLFGNRFLVLELGGGNT